MQNLQAHRRRDKVYLFLQNIEVLRFKQQQNLLLKQCSWTLMSQETTESNDNPQPTDELVSGLHLYLSLLQNYAYSSNAFKVLKRQ